MYWIVKNSKVPVCPYTGSTWDASNLRDRCRTEYTSYKEAEELANKLTEFNTAGFHVEVAPNNKAIIYYTDHYCYERFKDTDYKEFPIYSKIDFTLENILKLREFTEHEVIITNADSLPTWTYWGEGALQQDLDPYDRYDLYLLSFTKEELEDHGRNPDNYIILEVYNGYRS